MIEIYGKKGCGQCEEAKAFLDSHKIEYNYHDLSEKDNRKARQVYRDNKWKNLPVVIINDVTIDGYSKAAMELILDV